MALFEWFKAPSLLPLWVLFPPGWSCLISPIYGEQRHRSLSWVNVSLCRDEYILWCWSQVHHRAHQYRGHNIFLLVGLFCLQYTHHNFHHHWWGPCQPSSFPWGGLDHFTQWQISQSCLCCSTVHFNCLIFFHLPPQYCTPGRRVVHNCWFLLSRGCSLGCASSFAWGCACPLRTEPNSEFTFWTATCGMQFLSWRRATNPIPDAPNVTWFSLRDINWQHPATDLFWWLEKRKRHRLV